MNKKLIIFIITIIVAAFLIFMTIFNTVRISKLEHLNAINDEMWECQIDLNDYFLGV